jgi:ABC-type transport system involved in multi-copper enzyme maturation permease subunit
VRLLRSEFLKLRTAPRTTLGLTLGLLAITVLGAGSIASSASGEFGSNSAVWDLMELVSISAVFTLILGILIITWEYRHGTITPTFLAAPRRERVMAGKVLTAFVVGVILAALCLGLALAIAALWLSGLDVERGQWELAGRILLGAGLWSVFGLGIGAAIQSQVGTIVSALIWFLLVENILSVIPRVERVSDYLPGAAIDRFISTSSLREDPGVASSAYGIWGAALLVTAYVVGALVLGTLLVQRRDV